MAQSPMESTTRDFWKMIMERECRVVVMLCGLEEDKNVHFTTAIIFIKLSLLYNYYRKYVISTGRMSQLKFRKSMNSVLKQKLRITAVTTLRGYWLLLTRYNTAYSNVLHELFCHSLAKAMR